VDINLQPILIWRENVRKELLLLLVLLSLFLAIGCVDNKGGSVKYNPNSSYSGNFSRSMPKVITNILWSRKPY